MANKKKSFKATELVTLPLDYIEDNINTVQEDTLIATIKSYKEKGWDDNRIAARLMIQKSIVTDA
tara:strand:- start:19405 stop:19599 length:195 start_codon:yes stop_codon:yes gene_type:complete